MAHWRTVAAFLSVFACSCAAIAGPRGGDVPEERRQVIFDTGVAADFGDPRPLRAYVARHHPRRRGPQHFCVVGYRDGGPRGYPIVWIHWREGKELILWEGRDPDYPTSLLTMGRKSLDLTRDVVADPGSSSYLVTGAWVAERLADCAGHGSRYVVLVR